MEFPHLQKRCWDRYFRVIDSEACSTGNVTDEEVRECLSTIVQIPMKAPGCDNTRIRLPFVTQTYELKVFSNLVNTLIIISNTASVLVGALPVMILKNFTKM